MQFPIRQKIADRVWRWRRATYAVSAAVVLVTLASVFLSISTPSSTIEVSSAPTFFDANRALRTTQELARLYSDRHLGSEDAAGAAAWLTDKLSSLDIEHFNESTLVPYGDKRVAVDNIWVVLPGTSPRTIVFSAPRDPATDVRLSALAQAAPTACLIDLIQVFSTRSHQRTLVFLSSEGGSQGGLGLSAFLHEYPDTERIETVISVQALGMEGRDFLQAGITGPGITTPGWLVETATRVLARTSLDLRLPNLQEQIADQALRLYSGEQVAALRAGIPGLTLYDSGEGTVTSGGLATQGTALERLLLSLDNAGSPPRDPGTAIVLASGRYFTHRSLTILGILALLPAILMTFSWLAVTRLRPEGWLRHLRNLLSFVIPVAVTLFLAWVAARVGLIPVYLNQAMLSSPEATQPNWIVGLTLLLIGLVLFIISRHFLGYLKPVESRATTEMAKLTGGLALLTLGLIFLLASSPFSLAPAATVAWIWPLCTSFLEPPSPAMPWWPNSRSNLWLLALGLIGPLGFYAYLSANTAAGWFGAWWFFLVQMVSGAYGIIGPAGTAFVAAGLLLLMGSRRLRLKPVESLQRTNGLGTVEPPPRVQKVRKKTRQTES